MDLDADRTYEAGLELLRSADPHTPERLKRAIGHLKLALKGYPLDARWPRWSAVVLNLAQAYGRYAGAERVPHQARLESIERAIALDSELVDLARQREDVRKEAYAHYQLAQLYRERLDGDRAANVEEALAHCALAEQTWTREGEPLRWAWLQRLSGYLYYRRLCGEPVDNIQTSISRLSQALEIMDGMREQEAQEWAETQFYLGVSLHRLSELIDEQPKHLALAIQALEAARQGYARCPSLPHERAETLHHLALAYLDLNTGNVRETLARCVDWLEEVVGTYHESSPRWTKAQIDLGAAYLKSKRGGRSESIEQAIDCFNLVLEKASPLEPDLHALLLHHLSVAYATRLIEDRIENLRKARAYSEQALEAVDERDRVLWATIQADRTGTLWRLGTLEATRSRREATRCFQAAIRNGEALLATPGVERLSYLCAFTSYILGNLYADLGRGPTAGDRERAIACFKRALAFYGPHNYAYRWANAQGDLGVLYLDLGQEALAVHHFAEALREFSPEAYPVETLRVARNLADTYLDMGRWQEAREPYQKAIRAADLLYRASLLRSSKQAELAQAPGLYARAGFGLAQDEACLRDAVLTLEQGRARLLADALDRDRVRLEALKQSDPERAQALVETMDEYDELLRSEVALEQDTVALLKAQGTRELGRRLEQIELPALAFEELASAARSDTPLVYASVTPAGSVALIVRPGEIERVPCPLTEQDLRAHVWGSGRALDPRSYLGAYARWRQNPQAPGARVAWFKVLSETTRWLWDVWVGELVGALAGQGIHQAVLIPQGWLGLLPLHAAWTGDPATSTEKRCWAMDEVRFAYAPNARALLSARAVAVCVETERLFFVEDPDGSLRYSNLEAFAACHWFDECELLGGPPATEPAVVERLRACSVAHFSCHGSAGFGRPLEGGLHLANQEKLTLREILALRLPPIRLAVLSACETGIPGTELPDEVVSLPTGLIQAGVAGVVGSLWAVADVSTTMLMTRFYELWKGCGREPPDALRDAQAWLRDTTNGQRAAHYRRFLPEFGGSEEGLPVPVADRLFKASIAGDADQNDFAHPFYWAAFTYTGV